MPTATMAPTTIVLIGMMGSGKTSVGHALADRTGWRYLDNDELVRAVTGRAPDEIDADDGEDALHRAEADALRHALAMPPPLIAAAAAWVVDDPDSVSLLRGDAGGGVSAGSTGDAARAHRWRTGSTSGCDGHRLAAGARRANVMLAYRDVADTHRRHRRAWRRGDRRPASSRSADATGLTGPRSARRPGPAAALLVGRRGGWRRPSVPCGRASAPRRRRYAAR